MKMVTKGGVFSAIFRTAVFVTVMWMVLVTSLRAETQGQATEGGHLPIRFVGSWDDFALQTPAVLGWKTRVKLYADYEFTHMDEHPTSSGGVVPQQDFFSQRHGNLLLGAEKEQVRLRVNLETYALTADGDGERFLQDTVQFGVLEYYGEYTHRDWLKIRFGKSLAPFGLFNDIRYLVPLYATVMLPFIYEPTGNVTDYEAFYPPNANVMIHGVLFPAEDLKWNYALYWGTGERNNRKIVSSLDLGRDPTWGLRTTATFLKRITTGFSLYTVNINPQGEGREWMSAWDIELGPYGGVTTQAELAMGFRDRAADRNSWNLRMLYDAGILHPNLSRFTPYIMFDRLDDNKDPLQRKKQNRYAAGVTTRLTNNVTWKNELHWHNYADLDDGPLFVQNKGRRTWMFRSSMIVTF